jgi:hypothetical protein
LKYLPSDKYRIKPLKYFLGAMRCTGANYCWTLYKGERGSFLSNL